MNIRALSLTILIGCCFIEASVFAGVLDFRPELEQVCSPPDIVITKKILLALASNDSSEKGCNASLKFLTKKCQNKIVCDDIVALFNKFSESKSSNLIGE